MATRRLKTKSIFFLELNWFNLLLMLLFRIAGKRVYYLTAKSIFRKEKLRQPASQCKSEILDIFIGLSPPFWQTWKAYPISACCPVRNASAPLPDTVCCRINPHPVRLRTYPARTAGPDCAFTGWSALITSACSPAPWAKDPGASLLACLGKFNIILYAVDRYLIRHLLKPKGELDGITLLWVK